MQLQAFDEQSQARLSELLDDKALEGSCMRCDEVQAFVLALLSGPDELNTAEWLPEVLGEEAFSVEEQAEIEGLVLNWAADMRATLAKRELPDLWLYEGGSEEEPDFFTWCNAYLYALDVVPTDWFETVDNEDFEDLFYPVMALAGMYDEGENGKAIVTLSDKELTQLESELPHALLDIYNFWQAIIHKPQTVRREGEKVGRNAPCPCESGKKYKACCGKNE